MLPHSIRNYCCVQQNLQCTFTLFSTCSEKSHTRVCESLCNQPAWQMTKAVPWQCTNHLLQGNHIYCKREAASVLCYPQGAWDNTWETWVKPWRQPSIYKAKLGMSFLQQKPRGNEPSLFVWAAPEPTDFFLSHTGTGVITTTMTCPSCVCHAETHRGEFSFVLLLESGVGQCLPFQVVTSTTVAMLPGTWAEPPRAKPTSELQANSVPRAYVHSTRLRITVTAYFVTVQSNH